MSRLVIIDEELVVLEEYGEFTPEQAKVFFTEALDAIHFKREFPKAVIQNEVQMVLLTDTLAKMGLLHGDPNAIQDWMRPYIQNEILRQTQRRNLYQRTTEKIASYRGQVWDWIKAEIFGGISRLISRIINYFTSHK